MLLHLTSTDPKGQEREFFCQINKLEVAFDFLSDIVAKGTLLTQAYLLDDGIRTDLPVTVFDGKPFLMAIQDLEEEWVSLLNMPLLPELKNDSVMLLIQQRAKQLATKVASYQKLIVQLEQLLHRTHNNFSSGPLKTEVVSQYKLMIDRNRVWLIKAQVSHKVVLERLQQLTR